MSADGNWSLVISTPIGERHATLSIKTAGNAVTGTQSADGNSTAIYDGAIDGNTVSWKVDIADPMPMTLEFKGTVDGDKFDGSVGLGSFGEASFSGTRA